MKRAAILFLLLASPLCAQGKKEDYDRSARLPALTQGKVFRDSVDPHWQDDGDRFWYRNDLPEGKREYILVHAAKGTRASAFDHGKLAKGLAAAMGKKVDADRLALSRLTFAVDGQTLHFDAWSIRFEANLKSYEVRPLGMSDKPAVGDLAPLPKIRPTIRNGEKSSITFVNQRKEAVELFWLPSDGERRSYGIIEAGKEFSISTFDGHVWLIVADKKPLAAYESRAEPSRVVIGKDLKPGAAPKPKKKRTVRSGSGNQSPDGKWTAFFRDHNFFVRDNADDKEIALSKDGVADNAYRGAVYWSPDSSRVVALRTAKGDERKVHLIESSPKDDIYPRLHTIAYAKPGDKMPITRPRLFDVAAAREIPVGTDLFPNPWSLSQFRWMNDSSEFVFLYNQRGHQVLRLLAVDAKTGKARAVIDESAKTFVDYSGKSFLEELPDTNEWLWLSERDGWNHLYLYDHHTGLKQQITKGAWLVRGIDKVDAKKRQIWFRAGGIHPGQDPYHVHFCRIDFDGKNLVKLTDGDGNHRIRHSPDGRYFVDTYSRVDMPPVSELRRADDGALVCVLERADWSALLKAGWKVPERFVAKGRDGTTDIHGVIYRPTNFDPKKSYPIIEYIYAGPHSAFVPREFRSLFRQQQLAELGFIVVQIDGMGTSHRSKAFHDVCWKNLGDSGFPDRILWIKAAAAKYAFMDAKRVGIYGGSAGGQSTLRALLAFGYFYIVGVADCGCHDNRIDKIWWNELWMGYPIGPHYAEQSNVTNAHKLTGKLLLTVGELDRNVDPASTMQVVNSLVKAKKDFDLLIVPGSDHGAGESPYANRRRMDFFVRHLHGIEPPDRNR